MDDGTAIAGSARVPLPLPEWPEVPRKAEGFLQVACPAPIVGTGGGSGMRWNGLVWRPRYSSAGCSRKAGARATSPASPMAVLTRIEEPVSYTHLTLPTKRIV